MARFTSDRYIDQLGEDCEKLRKMTVGLQPKNNVEFKHAWGMYLKAMNILGNAIQNRELNELRASGVDIDKEAKLQLIDLGSDNDKD